eukprot:CAMPEP_0201477918 /NCGR_PEP_ID=MMETSP0151_2-20130828/2855_1 /ASSEMBLY_ACC=CAM_ASM_000257 /TAXON_ID=200890 /ORGANISM="Paramoeba atlantica, Strain 621/1 / CCAP 1560/9" /LENGTH=945 /DNA_ID=CAMNT_0047858801 /DNA_START=93 /DNA_END=2927 /DNA_ORIENTATION=-
MATLKKRRKKESESWSELLLKRSVNVVPVVIRETVEWIKRNARRIEGLFRVTGSFSNVRYLKDQYTKAGDGMGLVDLDSVGCKFSIASVIVHFLDDLQDTLLTASLYKVFMAIKDVQTKELKKECLRQVLGLLPVGCRAVLNYLMAFLKEIHQMSQYNKMTASNLAIVFAPCLLRSDSCSTDGSLMEECQTGKLLVEMMILQYDDIFTKDPKIELPPEIKDPFRSLYLAALDSYSSSSTPSIGSVDRHRSATPNANQRKLLNEHQRFKNQTTIMVDVRSHGLNSNKSADISSLPDKVVALCRGCLVRHLLQNISKKSQTKINLAIRKVLILQQNLVENMEELTARYFPHFILLIQQKRLNLDTTFISVARDCIRTSKAFLADLHNLFEEWPILRGFDRLLKFSNQLQHVARYSGLITPFLKEVNRAAKKSAELEQWLSQASLDSKDGLSLEELVTLPVKQHAAYRIPLQDLSNAALDHEEWAMSEGMTLPKERDSTYISEILLLLKGLTLLSHSIKQSEDLEMLRYWQEIVDGDIDFVKAGRSMVRQGNLTIGSKKRFVMLFSDLLVICKANDSSHRKSFRSGGSSLPKVFSNFQFIESHPLEMIRVEESPVASQTHKKFVIKIGETRHEIVCRTLEEKVQWLTDLQVSSTKHSNKFFNIGLKEILDRERCKRYSAFQAAAELDCSDPSECDPAVTPPSGSTSGSEDEEPLDAPEALGLLINEITHGREDEPYLFRYLADDYSVQSLRNALEVPDDKRKVSLRSLVKTTTSHQLVYVLRSFFEDLPGPLIPFTEETMNRLFPLKSLLAENTSKVPPQSARLAKGKDKYQRSFSFSKTATSSCQKKDSTTSLDDVSDPKRVDKRKKKRSMGPDRANRDSPATPTRSPLPSGLPSGLPPIGIPSGLSPAPVSVTRSPASPPHLLLCPPSGSSNASTQEKRGPKSSMW